MKKLSIFTLSSLTLALAPTANAIEFGLGASFSNEEATVYFPIALDNLLIEPSIRYGKSSERTELQRSLAQDDQITNNEVKVAEVGLGLFINNELKENFAFYYGGRIGYSKQEQNNTATTIIDGTSSSKTESDGFFIHPTIGLSYQFVSKLSLAIESGIKTTQLKGDVTRLGRSGNSILIVDESFRTKRTVSTTETNIILRYKF